jgi:LysR family transcriptional activator of nhaA
MPGLRHLNFKHLRYFAAVAQQGSVTAAAKALHVAPQTVSAQLAELESAMGRQLFDRFGRRLLLNAEGEAALEYAKSIFSLGEELVTVMDGRTAPRRTRLRIGITDSVPKMLATKLLRPVIAKKPEQLELYCTEGPLNLLVSQVLDHRLDLVLSDSPPLAELNASLRVQMLVKPGLSFLAAPAVAERYPGRFPDRLDGMPFLLGSADSSMTLAIQQWWVANNVHPRLTGRFDDSALMKAFAEQGLGAIAVPSTVEREACRHHGLKVLGRTDALHQPIYAVASRLRRQNAMVEVLFSASG